ncbi:MAG: nucleotidyltransferase domain-containing protein [Myxococcales bacterium]|nr:nucleotidyltransferase domain-containing protein [Myxococcales bacterium]
MSPLAERLRAALEGRSDVVCAWLFGSQARGDAHEGSDVDVAVLRGRPRPRTLDDWPVELEAAVEEAVGSRVDLVLLDGADSDLVHRVLRDGVLVVERDRAARIAFEVFKRNEWFDLEPVRRRVRRLAP